MKKSSILHKPKQMLSKSFNPAKCKTALKLASSRIKLLKNKKEIQVKQMKRELAQLLESGQDQTARIRVEHVIREEKMMAAYELIEIYCELIVARLPIIETQKNCPIDLKEAIASVIFASPRCGDIPELLDVRKHFTGKYGKEFTSAAIELRPDCGVSRMLIEKLSARAPDGQTKIKTLTAIAEEHNVKWNPKLFGENEALPPNDLLNGPAIFEKATKIHAEEPHFHTPDVQAPSPPMHNQSSSISENNVRSSLGTENLASGWNNGGSNSVSSVPQSGTRPDTAETRQSNHQEGSAYSFSRQNWSMNFKDATSAAQAAAESAERASMAARAAAELSSHGKFAKQYSPESEHLSGHSLRGEGTGKHSISRVTEYYAPKDSANSSLCDQHPIVEKEDRRRRYSVESQKPHTYSRTGEETRIPTSKLTDAQLPSDSANSSFAEKPPGLQDVQRENVGRDYTHRVFGRSYPDSDSIEKRYPQTSSSTSKESFDSDPPVSGLREAGRYSENSLFKGDEPEMSLRKETDKEEPERVNFRQVESNYYDHDYFEEDKITEQSSNIHFSSHSGVDDNYLKSGSEKSGTDSSDHHLVGVNEDLYEETAQASSHDGGVVTFDDYGSDNEDFGFPNSSHLNFNESRSFRASGRTSPPHFSADTGSGSLAFQASQLDEGSESLLFSTKRNSFADFGESSEVLVDSSELDKDGPVKFDDSDGPGSDNETDTNQPWGHNAKDSTDLPSKQNHTLSSASSSFHESHWKNNQRKENVVQSQEEDFGFSKAPTDHTSPRLGKSMQDPAAMGKLSLRGSVGEVDKLESSRSSFVIINDTKHVEASSNPSRTLMHDEDSRHGTALNFGKLTGGLRQKGQARLSYQSNQLDDFSASSTEVADADLAVENFINARKSKLSDNTRRSRLPSSHLDSDGETSEEEYEKRSRSRGRESFLHNAERNSKMKPNARVSVAYFDSGSSDSEDDSTRKVFAGRSHLVSGVSRRTKSNPSDSGSVSRKVRATSAVSSNSGEGRNPTTSFSSTETPLSSESHFSQFKDFEKYTSVRQGYKPNLESKGSSVEENKKSSAGAQTPISVQILESSESTKKPSSGNVVAREDSNKKASHVHPKLPDYDTIAARLQALRTNRQ